MSKKAYSVPWWNRVGRRILVPVFRLAFKIMTRPQVYGLENVPAQGSYLIVYNHISIVDPPFVASFLPVQPEVLGAVDIWNRPWQNLLARIYGGIPVHRGEVDWKAMNRVLSAIRSGLSVMIAPEGGRSHVPGLRKAKTGIVYIVEQTRVPVLPIGVTGTTDENLHLAVRGKRPVIEMRVGKPFDLPETLVPGLSPKEDRQGKADYIMEHIAALLPEEYQGVYARPVVGSG
ncbi:MAG TPA: lysophospholipid acyltransferase family protein [Anaerolineaceae bacterium]|nr:lysophospholipid acyltransferase family protein [Anaerolineaceae bacterium]